MNPKIAAYLVAVALLFSAGIGMGHHFTDASWQKKWDAHVKQDKAAIDAAVAKARADERAAAKLSDTSTAKQVEVQTRIVGHTITLIKEVPKYVTVQQDARSCVSYGLERLLNAAVTGSDPASYQLPPGVTDDTCTGTTASALAAAIAENYGAARANAAQLNGLIEDVKQRIDIANGPM